MTDTPKPPPSWNDLTPRQREVAQLLATGDNCREVAKALGLGIKTVDTHRGDILKRLGLRNTVDLARMLIREGRVKP